MNFLFRLRQTDERTVPGRERTVPGRATFWPFYGPFSQ